MNKRAYVLAVGVIVLLGVLWLTMWPSKPKAVGQNVAAQPSAVAAPRPEENASVPQRHEKVAARDTAVTVAKSSETAQLPVSTQALPIDVSPGFEFLSKPATEMKDTDPMWTHWRRHQVLESEPRDEEWAPRMETALRQGIQDSLMKRGMDTQRIELPVVECRTNGCEIQAIGWVQDNSKEGFDLQRILPGLLMGSLAGEFDMEGNTILLTAAPNQRVTYLAQLPRKKPT